MYLLERFEGEGGSLFFSFQYVLFVRNLQSVGIDRVSCHNAEEMVLMDSKEHKEQEKSSVQVGVVTTVDQMATVAISE